MNFDSEIAFVFWFFVFVGGGLLAIHVLARSDGYPDNDDLPGMEGRREINRIRWQWLRKQGRDDE